MIFFIANIDKAHGVGCDAPWVVKLPITCSLTAESSKESSSWVKDLNAVVVSIGDDELSDAIDGNTS